MGNVDAVARGFFERGGGRGRAGGVPGTFGVRGLVLKVEIVVGDAAGSTGFATFLVVLTQFVLRRDCQLL